MDFKNIPKKYRPIPFWSWNEKLDTKETAEQIDKMNSVGIGGFFMHARGGLQTEYMGEEWFKNVKTAAESAEKHEMGAWAYDENGWPSGFGNGLVNGLGIEYQQKYLRISKSEPSENVICKSGEHWFYFDVNPFYVDVLNEKAVKKFIDVAYKPYYEKYGNKIEGLFTDEPQMSRLGIPWSFVFKDEYGKKYGEDLYEHLESLLLPVGNYKDIRIKFWKMVTDLFSQSFMKQIYDQCSEWGVKFTGHLVLEETLLSQLTANGACMPHYEYMHIPGMDWLGRKIYDCLTPIQVSSVAEQLGKEQVVSETFALCGHNVSFAELKGIYEWQMLHGINLLCQHLEGYSIRGIRKRDYPPAMYYQQPWWSEYEKFNNAMSREGMILSKGKKNVDVLVIHPQTTAWTMYDEEFGPEVTESKNPGIKRPIDEINNRLLNVIKTLEKKHITYHLGDETIMERHARIENGMLIIGKQSYTHVITSCCEVMLPFTEKLLSELEKSGGKIVTADELPVNDITDNEEITYTKREFDDYTVHYFVNTSSERKTAKFTVSGKRLDIYTGELFGFAGTHEFEPWGSLMIIDDGTVTPVQALESVKTIRPEGNFAIAEPIQNSLTLDRCDYYFDGELQEKDGYVLNICERANALGRKVQIHQDYHIKINDIPKTLHLACETPEIFQISVNGEKIDKVICGYFRDKSFKTLDITKHIKEGDNTISFDCDFVQSEEFYKNLKNAYAFESEKNKLVYDMEIEAIYLLGDFSLKTQDEWMQLENKAVRYNGGFEIVMPKKSINIKNIEQQGYPFFCGEMCIEGEIDITGENPVLELDLKGINAVRVEINGKTKVMLTDNRMPLLDFGASGKTKIKLTLINNLRNLLGPHHLAKGESTQVMPAQFFKEPCIWNPDARAEDWCDGYCFVETGI